MAPNVISVAIGINTPRMENRFLDLAITIQDQLILRSISEASHTDIHLGRATKERIDFLIECLIRLKIHAT